MEIRQYTVYKFNELSKKSKEKAKEDYYEKEDYPFLEEDLENNLQKILKENKIIEFENSLKVYCSLSYCQGDGVCFIGKFKWKKYFINIQHTGRYCHENSVSMEIFIDESFESEPNNYEEMETKFKKVYDSICYKVEKYGYSIIENRMNNKKFNEHCESNNYMFKVDGTMD